MIEIIGEHEPISKISRHSFICDIQYFEGPLLSLYRYRDNSWLYLWCDIEDKINRWLVFPITRESFVSYLERKKSLLEIIKDSLEYLILDIDHRGKTQRRTLKRISSPNEIQEYLPTEESLFDESLAQGLNLSQEIKPSCYDVPIDGKWFFSDLDRFLNLYSDLYAFFYCTKPRFVKDIGTRVQKRLSAPWKGGFSRVNLFKALEDFIPSVHDLEIKKIAYASPGEIKLEALNSVGNSIGRTLNNFIENEEKLLSAEKEINFLLSMLKLKRKDLSALNDETLDVLPGILDDLKACINVIGQQLSIQEEFNEILKYSPNIVVTSKVILSVLVRVKRLTEFQKNKQIHL